MDESAERSAKGGDAASADRPRPASSAEARDGVGSQELLARAFRASPIHQGVVEVLPDDLRLLALNDACAALLESTPGRLEGRRAGELDLPPGLLDLWLESCLDAWRQHGPTTFRFTDVTTDPPRRLLITVAPLDEGGPSERWCCSFHLLEVTSTSRRPPARVGEDDGDEEAHFRHLYDAAPSMLWAADAEGEREVFNRTWLDFTGRRLEEARGEGWLDAVHPEDREACRETWLEAFHGREAYRLEYRLERADGVHRWVLDSGVPRFRSDGRFLGFVGSCVDISRRRQTEARLRLSERWYRELIESTDNLVIQIDAEDRLTFVNPRSREIWGAEPEECVGFPFLDFVHPDERDAAAEELHRLRRAGEEAITFECRHQGRRGGPRTLLWTMNPHFDSAGELVSASAIAQDVTERRRAEEERRRLDEHLREAQRLESLGVLAGGIAHDFNNLLMTILGSASLLLDEVGPDGAMHNDLAQIESAALRAAELTKQMLAYSGKGRFVVEPTDLSELIGDMRPLLGSSVSATATLELHLDDNLPAVEADTGQIRQVLMNLVTNASEALGDAGDCIRVTTGRRRLERSHMEDLVLGHDLEPGEYVVLEVQDEGEGMDEEVMGRIFDPFFTTKFTGRGLGLAAVLGIVRGHGGALRVVSEPGRGSRFVVYLPEVERREASPRCEESEVPSENLAPEGTVLVVDDEEEVRRMASRMLGGLGFDVLEAGGGEEALEIYRRQPERVRCVLLDLTMPAMDGEMTFRELQKIRPEVRVILSSGYGEPEDDRFGGRGPAAFLQKPYRQTDLILTLDRVLDLRH